MPSKVETKVLPVTLEEVKDYLVLDLEDTSNDKVLNTLINTADRYIENACGKNYDRTDAEAKNVALMICHDLFTTRETTGKTNGTINRMYLDLLQHIRLSTPIEEELTNV